MIPIEEAERELKAGKSVYLGTAPIEVDEREDGTVWFRLNGYCPWQRVRKIEAE